VAEVLPIDHVTRSQIGDAVRRRALDHSATVGAQRGQAVRTSGAPAVMTIVCSAWAA
jgi:hypothetical protein